MTSINVNTAAGLGSVVAWTENQAGARVVVIRLNEGPFKQDYADDLKAFTWQCLGRECGAPSSDYHTELTKSDARSNARYHAAECCAARTEDLSHADLALVQLGLADSKARWNEYHPDKTDDAVATAQVGTGHALLAIAQELTALRTDAHQAEAVIRQELAQLTGAVRELTAAVTTSAAPLADIAKAIGDAPDHNEALGDIATVVESLMSRLDEQQSRRRSWFRRRRNTTPASETPCPVRLATADQSDGGAR